MKKLLVILLAALAAFFVYVSQQEKKATREAELWAEATRTADAGPSDAQAPTA